MGRKNKTVSVRAESRLLNTGRYSFYLVVSISGTRTRETLNLFTETGVEKMTPGGKKMTTAFKAVQSIADEIAKIRLEELKSGIYGTTTALPFNSFTAHNAFKAYLEQYTQADIRRTKSVYNKVTGFFNGSKLLSSLSTTDCEDFKQHLEDTLKNETARNYFLTFKKTLKWAVKKHLIRNNPCDGISVKEDLSSRTIKDVLTDEELRTLIATPCGNDDVKRAFLFACFTGIGYIEAKTANWNQITENEKGVKFSYLRAKTRGKKKEPVSVFISGAKDFLPAKQDNQNLLFPQLPGNVAVNKDLKFWAKRAGVEKNLSFYCGRHTYGTRLTLANVNPIVVAKNLGHASLKYVQRYANHLEDAQQESTASIDL